MAFEKHLCSVSRAASQILGILRKSWRVFHDRSLLGMCFRGFVLPVLEYCFTVWYTAAAAHLPDRAVSGARFLTWGVFKCELAHRRSVAVLCMLYKTRCNRCNLFLVFYMDRMCQCGLRSVLWLHIGILMRCRTYQYSRTFIHLSVSLWNDLADSAFDDVWRASLKSKANTVLLA